MKRLAKDDHIIAVACERHHGPGWSNHTATVVVRDRDGALRTEVLQPDEFGHELSNLFSIGCAVHEELRFAANKSMGRKS